MNDPHPARYIGASNQERLEDDFYPTPDYAVYPLFEAEMFPGDIWEPACGDGAISETARRYGYGVFSSDLYDHGYGVHGWDFFAQKDLPPGCHSIITNPPYKVKNDGHYVFVEDWIEHALSMPRLRKMALFLKTTALGGGRRSEVLENSPFVRILQFRNRVTLYRNGEIFNEDGTKKHTGMVDFAWYIFERGYTGSPTIHWLDHIHPEQLRFWK